MTQKRQDPFDPARSAWADFSLYEYGDGSEKPSPREIYQQITPAPVRTEYVPQTRMESVWVFYEFASPEDRDAAIASPPANFPKLRVPPEDVLESWTIVHWEV